MADIRIIADNSAEFLRELERKSEAALEACGIQAVSHAKENITDASRVDTGNLRNSMNHKVQDDSCYIGSNVQYAIYNEMGTGIYADGGGRQTPWSYQDDKGNWHRTRGMKPIHFLKNAIQNNINEYREIIIQYLSR